MNHLLEVKNLITRFYTEEGTVHAVNVRFTPSMVFLTP